MKNSIDDSLSGLSQENGQRLTLMQTLDVAWNIVPSFRTASISAAVGLAVATAGILLASGSTAFIISAVGCLISGSSVDQMNKILVKLKDIPRQDYTEAKADSEKSPDNQTPEN
jgi:hypothetical protein